MSELVRAECGVTVQNSGEHLSNLGLRHVTYLCDALRQNRHANLEERPRQGCSRQCTLEMFEYHVVTVDEVPDALRHGHQVYNCGFTVASRTREYKTVPTALIVMQGCTVIRPSEVV